MHIRHLSLNLAAAAPLALAALSLAPQAHADSVLVAETNLVSGTLSTSDSFVAPTAGKVTVSVQSLNWPTALSSLSFSATSASSVLMSWSGSGLSSDVATFEVGAGTYFTHIMASAGGVLDLGLYSMTLTFSPNAVPLPAGGWLLLTGLFAIAGLAHAARPRELTGTTGA